MVVNTVLNQRLDAEYKRIKPYLNETTCCTELHKMCDGCESFVGLSEHNYENCKDRNCFRFYLAYSDLQCCIGYDLFGG